MQSNNERTVVCYCCGKHGHYSGNCPDKNQIKREDWAMKQEMQMMSHGEIIDNHVDNNVIVKKKKKIIIKTSTIKSQRQYQHGI